MDQLFWEKVEKTSTCWLWKASLTNGYGQLVRNKKRHLAHRYSYEICCGSIPKGLQLDHLCRVRNCVNPAHLEPVTCGENLRRGERATKTHCKNGHEFSFYNTHLTDRKHRHCRTCDRNRKRIKKKLTAEKFRNHRIIQGPAPIKS